MEYKIDIRRSNRKTLAFEIKEKGILIVRTPFNMSEVKIKQEIKKHETWIDKHMKMVEERRKENVEKYTVDEIRQMLDEALEIIPPRVSMYADKMGLRYGRITIRNQRTRWGSCSSKKNLNFNCLLVMVPEQVMDYVIVHELCHLVEFNHSKDFWSLVEEMIPDFRECKKWLNENGNYLITRL